MVSGRMSRWLMLVAVAVVLPLAGGVVGHWLTGDAGARGAVVVFGFLVLAYVAWHAKRWQETNVID